MHMMMKVCQKIPGILRQPFSQLFRGLRGIGCTGGEAGAGTAALLLASAITLIVIGLR